MDSRSTVIDSNTLREQLISPHPMQRAIALHALEVELEHTAAARANLARAVARFTERGIPYYALNDPYFREWVGKAVTYWQLLRAAAPAR